MQLHIPAGNAYIHETPIAAVGRPSLALTLSRPANEQSVDAPQKQQAFREEPIAVWIRLPQIDAVGWLLDATAFVSELFHGDFDQPVSCHERSTDEETSTTAHPSTTPHSPAQVADTSV
ncbi:hypothetical protein C8035_v007637 [Colletotrichum spinosum]|uniref:Uncharacterized protein n=1 Tax=Colletotrichum spinosum TaxID=1347390 RepID=A0A4R8QFY8_9PEZI|nr:hypothetical protein C8035_v007637 [Colletotrichum spinosum]